ncbi:MAG TPA: RluA family pseudouridine synthase [Bryobacteraceae bacterium]|nr:RluA family pseudouridine synthase [Bryobacteraceae bacterium]
MSAQRTIITATVDDSGKRLDQLLQLRLPDYSRSRLQDWIKDGRVLVDGSPQKASYTIRGSEQIAVEPAELTPLRAFAEDIPIDILHLDSDLIAVNKPAGLVVHAGAGQHSGTLVNALLHQFQTLSTISGDERPGIVHRIDKDTSGVLLVARTDTAHRKLAEQFAGRQVEKTYLALVQGAVKAVTGKITSPITRDPVRRTRMTTRAGHGRTALTTYKVLERLGRFTYLEIKIGTGRTHQIRVHMASLGHPVAGDTLYGAAAARYGRFFLHASKIRFVSPSTGETIELQAPLPPELDDWLHNVRRNSSV